MNDIIGKFERRTSDINLRALNDRLDDFQEWRIATDGRLNMIDTHVKDLKQGQQEIVTSVNTLATSIEANNKMTENIQSLITGSRLMGHFFKWLAGLIASGGIIFAALKAGALDLLHK